MKFWKVCFPGGLYIYIYIYICIYTYYIYIYVYIYIYTYIYIYRYPLSYVPIKPVPKGVRKECVRTPRAKAHLRAVLCCAMRFLFRLVQRNKYLRPFQRKGESEGVASMWQGETKKSHPPVLRLSKHTSWGAKRVPPHVSHLTCRRLCYVGANVRTCVWCIHVMCMCMCMRMHTR